MARSVLRVLSEFNHPVGITTKSALVERDIARALGRSQPSVSREVRRNSVRGVYDPRRAKGKARIRVQLSAAHSEADVRACVDAFVAARDAVG